jgi:hypothetical protein
MIKAKVSYQEKVFKPIKVEIQLDTIEDLVELWKRCNAPARTVDECVVDKSLYKYETNSDNITELWKMLNSELKKALSGINEEGDD